jgi:hypothetical protein
MKTDTGLMMTIMNMRVITMTGTTDDQMCDLADDQIFGRADRQADDQSLIAEGRDS